MNDDVLKGLLKPVAVDRMLESAEDKARRSREAISLEEIGLSRPDGSDAERGRREPPENKREV